MEREEKMSPNETFTVKATTYCMPFVSLLLIQEGSKAYYFHIFWFRSVKGLKEKWRLKGLVFVGREWVVSMILNFYLLLGVPTKYDGFLCLLLELAYQVIVESHEMAA